MAIELRGQIALAGAFSLQYAGAPISIPYLSPDYWTAIDASPWDGAQWDVFSLAHNGRFEVTGSWANGFQPAAFNLGFINNTGLTNIQFIISDGASNPIGLANSLAAGAHVINVPLNFAGTGDIASCAFAAAGPGSPSPGQFFWTALST